MTWSLSRPARVKAKRRASSHPRAASRRRLARFETLESRAMLTALPFGAMPDDTGEYMLGDVHVTVVLMESNPTLSPFDNNSVPLGGIGAPAESWTSNSIAAVKSKIEEGMQWWEQTLDSVLAGTEAAGRDLLNFSFDWTHADAPVQTGYEPIARPSNDFGLWMYDFLNVAGFTQSGNFSTDIRAFNNFQRQNNDADWAFTIFVVNNEVDADQLFDETGSFRKAFAFAGGRFMVVPADRPASSFAHEAGHMFWALDEYANSGSNHLSRRGYYNTPNSNHAGGGSQQASIMANGDLLDAAFAGKITSESSREMIGWRDSDDDGLFDVLDVPFKLEGIGRYDEAQEVYRFTGDTAVRTLPNQNSSGLQNDVTINRIRAAQVSIDDGPWTTVQTFAGRTYETPLDLSIPLSAGSHVIKIRTVDTRTGAMSPEFIGTTGEPSSTPTPGGISGFVYRDDNSNGSWDQGEPPLPDWAMDLVDENDEPLDLRRRIEPNHYVEQTVLNSVHTEVSLIAVGGDVSGSEVLAKTTTKAPTAGKVFGVRSITLGQVVDTWTFGRQLRINFDTPVSSLSIRAYSDGVKPSFARMEAFDSEGNLVGRYTTGALSGNGFEVLSLARAEGDIAYAIVRGHLNTEVVLDTLEWGPFSSATTNTLGAYSIKNLNAGDYRLKINLPQNHTLTSPVGATNGIATGTLAAGAGASVNFGIAVSSTGWYNSIKPLNVNADPSGAITAVDALLIIDWLNINTGQPSELPANATPHISGYIDVNNDGHCTPADALMVIDWLNSPEAETEGESLAAGGGSAAGFVAPAGGSAAEGEELAYRNAAEYYARNPIHFLSIPGDDEQHSHEEELHDHDQELIANAGSGISTVIDRLEDIQFPSTVLTTLGDLLEDGRLPPAAQQAIENRLETVTTLIGRHQQAIDRVAERLDDAIDLLKSRREDLEESLDFIADDVAAVWAGHRERLERLLRRTT